MNTPKITHLSGDHGVSDWVLGEYYGNSICPFRIVRAVSKGNSTRIEWEYADRDGVDEDLFSIACPDVWHPLKEVRQ